MFKRIVCLFLAVIMCFALTACKKSPIEIKGVFYGGENEDGQVDCYVVFDYTTDGVNTEMPAAA